MHPLATGQVGKWATEDAPVACGVAFGDPSGEIAFAPTKGVAMSGTETNKQLAQTFYDEVVAKGRVELLDTLASPDMVDHGAAAMGWKPGRDGFVQHIEWLNSGVSSINVTVDDLLAEGDRVVVYWTIQGTHTGEFFGVPATGREFTGTAVSQLSFENGL